MPSGRLPGSKSKKKYDKICLYCKEPFVSHYSLARYCSNTCCQNHYDLRKRTKFGHIYKCMVCGISLHPKDAIAHSTKHLTLVNIKIERGTI